MKKICAILLSIVTFVGVFAFGGCGGSWTEVVGYQIFGVDVALFPWANIDNDEGFSSHFIDVENKENIEREEWNNPYDFHLTASHFSIFDFYDINTPYHFGFTYQMHTNRNRDLIPYLGKTVYTVRRINGEFIYSRATVSAIRHYFIRVRSVRGGVQLYSDYFFSHRPVHRGEYNIIHFID